MNRIEKLNEVARSWVGTPFMPNAAVKGAGVSCQKLVGAIYIEAGVLPVGFEIPDGEMSWGRAHTVSAIEAVVQRSGRFVAVEAWQPGDLIGFKFGGCVHHLGVVLNAAGDFVHVLRNQGVDICNLNDAGYFSRIEKIWRPIA